MSKPESDGRDTFHALGRARYLHRFGFDETSGMRQTKILLKINFWKDHTAAPFVVYQPILNINMHAIQLINIDNVLLWISDPVRPCFSAITS